MLNCAEDVRMTLDVAAIVTYLVALDDLGWRVIGTVEAISMNKAEYLG